MKIAIKGILLLLLSVTSKISIAQYNPLPTSPCHLNPFYCPNKYQSYLVSNSNRIYLYENLKCTPSSNNGFDVTFSDNDNASCAWQYSHSGDVSTGAIYGAILTDTNIIVQFSHIMGSSAYRISSQHTVIQSMNIPNFSANVSATNKTMYALTKHPYDNILFFIKNVNNVNLVDTLNYNNIKVTPWPKLYFANDSVGYVFGKDTLNNNILLRSYDYGEHWNLVYYPVNGIANIQFKGDTGIAVGNHGTVYRTIDNGLTWNTIPSLTTKNLSSISIGPNEMYIAGDSAALYKSGDFGATWTPEIVSISDKITWVKVTNTGEVYFQAYNGVYQNNIVYKKNYFISVNELEFNKESLIIYPNPTSGIIDIQLKENTLSKFTVYVINSLGEVVLESNKSSVDLIGISSGLYSVELRTIDGEIFRSKVVKIDN